MIARLAVRSPRGAYGALVVLTAIWGTNWIAMKFALERADPIAGTASLNILAIPVVALLSSMLVFGERLAPSEWVGIGCIGIGLIIVSLRAWLASRRGERPLPDPLPLEGG